MTGNFVARRTADGASLIRPKPPARQGESVVLIRGTNGLGEVTVVATTRTGREMDDVPTRVEAIGEEEDDEKSKMCPSNVSLVLDERRGGRRRPLT